MGTSPIGSARCGPTHVANRERLLEAARLAFAAEGLSVPADEIARRAGVRSGTMHRHFPTMESLVEAFLVEYVESLAVEAERHAAADSGAAFFRFCTLMVERGMSDRAPGQLLTGIGVESPGARDGRR